MNDMTERLARLERELRAIFGDRLQSIVAYGLRSSVTSGTRATSHGTDGAPARVQTLTIVETLTRDDLRQCAAHVGRWHEAGLATPLVLTARELERSLDAFPLEFDAMLADHAVVAGRDPLEGLRVNTADIRRACEVQARSHLLHLREGFIETHGRADALAVLIVRSAAPFVALLTSLARLEGLDTHDASAAGRHAERVLQLSPGVMTDIVKLVDAAEISSADATRIFPGDLDATERLVKYVDGWRAK
jgi:hypothetical protein